MKINNIFEIPSSKYINMTSKEYSLYVAENRGLPLVWDGFKDGQRKALFVLQTRPGEIKTISLAGEMIARNIYVHGDAAAAQSIGRLAAPYINNLPLIKGVGNFGTKTKPGDVAAPRYTYVRKNSVTENIVFVDSNIVPMVDNYDGSTQSPKHYLPLIPTVLLNGISGMAPGFSTNILPRDINDVIDATISVLDLKIPERLNPKYTMCSGKVEHLGGNKWIFYGNCRIIDAQTIHVNDLPPGMTPENFRDFLDRLVEEKAIRYYEDDTSDVINITVKFFRGGCDGWSVDDALEFFRLYKKETEQLVVIGWDGKTIKPYDSPITLLVEFVSHRFEFFIVRYEKLKKDTEKKLSYFELVKACYDEQLSSLFTSLESKDELENAIVAIATKHSIVPTPDEVDKVASLPSYKWTKKEYDKVLNEIDEFKKSIKYYDTLLGDHDLIWDIYKQEVQRLKTLKFETGR